MKLFLTSAGIVPETKQYLLDLVGKPLGNLKLVFIPTAANPESDRWYINKDKLKLAELGINDISEVDLEKEDKVSLVEKLKGADIIFVDGGNTFYLLKYVRESGFDVLVKEFLERGGIYIGVSAGSMVAGPNIETANWKHADKNDVGLQDLAGINLVPFVIAPHIDGTNIEATKEEAAKAGYPVIALSDKQAVLIDGDRTEIVGAGEKIVFNHPLKPYFPQAIVDVGFDFDWDEKKVWGLDVPVIDMDINELVWHFEIPFYSDNNGKYHITPREIIDNPARYQEEYDRTMRADINYPLDVMENKGHLLLLDGLHRLMKLYIKGEKTVKARIVPRERIPQILP